MEIWKYNSCKIIKCSCWQVTVKLHLTYSNQKYLKGQNKNISGLSSASWICLDFIPLLSFCSPSSSSAPLTQRSATCGSRATCGPLFPLQRLFVAFTKNNVTIHLFFCRKVHFLTTFLVRCWEEKQKVSFWSCIIDYESVRKCKIWPVELLTMTIKVQSSS